MPDYRLYCLDERGHIHHPHDFRADDDAAALTAATDREHPQRDSELWQGARMVAKLPARRQA